MKKLLKLAKIRLSIAKELFDFLWKHKLWWLVPLVFVLFFSMFFFSVIGHTGVAAFIYPIF